MFDFDDDFEVFLAVASVGCIGLGIAYLVFAAFLSAVSRVVGRVTPENRRIEPGQVWLNLVPVFVVIWLPITVDRVAESLKNEFTSRGLDDPRENYGRTT